MKKFFLLLLFIAACTPKPQQLECEYAFPDVVVGLYNNNLAVYTISKGGDDGFLAFDGQAGRYGVVYCDDIKKPVPCPTYTDDLLVGDIILDHYDIYIVLDDLNDGSYACLSNSTLKIDTLGLSYYDKVSIIGNIPDDDFFSTQTIRTVIEAPALARHYFNNAFKNISSL